MHQNGCPPCSPEEAVSDVIARGRWSLDMIEVDEKRAIIRISAKVDLEIISGSS
jgi:hypothetical protein